MLTLALTAGEPAGIGPDLCIQWAQQHSLPYRVVVIADREMLEQRAHRLGCSLTFVPYIASEWKPQQAGTLEIYPVPVQHPVDPGVLDPANADYVLETLKIAVSGCQLQQFHAMVTAPVHKGVINEAGIPFTGHTEFLADLTQSQVVMMLVGGGMRVALATTHLPLNAVADAITAEGLEQRLRIIDRDLRTRFWIEHPCIAVAGLNPHAGESGHLGREEIEIIIPLLTKLRAEGMNLIGPLPADTLFNPVKLQGYDCVLAMYHDQGLPVLKYASFGSGVNVTLGLPLIRTSVDHGTALDLAGTGQADIGSFHQAIMMASTLAEKAARFQQ